MPTKLSAGILLYKKSDAQLMVLLVHPGGPFWKNKDLGSWTIPKGEFNSNEAPLDAAIREFEEETGTRVSGTFVPLQPIKTKSGKVVYAWALESEFDINGMRSNTFDLEWPPKSGKIQQIPEIDRAQWFSVSEAFEKINQMQSAFISELVEYLDLAIAD